MRVKDCNSCHYGRWYKYKGGLGKCVAPLQAIVNHDGIRGIGEDWAYEDCPVYSPRPHWLPKIFIDIGG